MIFQVWKSEFKDSNYTIFLRNDNFKAVSSKYNENFNSIRKVTEIYE